MSKLDDLYKSRLSESHEAGLLAVWQDGVDNGKSLASTNTELKVIADTPNPERLTAADLDIESNLVSTMINLPATGPIEVVTAAPQEPAPQEPAAPM